MSEFGWEESLEIGIDDLDEDHKKLFEMLDEFGLAASAAADFTQLQVLISEIRGFFVAHIRKEDEIMGKLTSGLSLEHKSKHEQEHGAYLFVLDQISEMLRTGQWESARDNAVGLKKLMFFRELVNTDYEMVRCMIQEGIFKPE
ncbi:hemerythrin domain-containing protein [Magnetospira sp. QH-2]|uniref:hemerythrin domain-containing protein n=1 Tax=Magnetospira sp. (strain QH-2) TaxID=1288970 RepID=UPI00130E5AE9|nr:hemerythrin domain-containing protein [Magnetospira sp. QH-2]